MKNALRLPADRVHSYTTSWDVTRQDVLFEEGDIQVKRGEPHSPDIGEPLDLPLQCFEELHVCPPKPDRRFLNWGR